MDEAWDEIFNNGYLEAIEEISNINKSSIPNQSISQDESEEQTIVNHEIAPLLVIDYKTRDDLLDSVRKNALAQGYAIVIRRSKTEKSVLLGCDRGGIYRGNGVPIEQRKRKTASRLISCPFEIIGKKKPDGFWKVETKNLIHNHNPSVDMCGHPSCRRFTKIEIQRIKEMSMAGIPARQILSSLRQDNPNLQAISRTINNVKAKITRESLLGRTMMQALMEELGSDGFTYEIKYDEKGHLTHLLFAHPTSVAMTECYSNVFVMDCTYKTNKYKMPLLNIIGVTSFNKSFYSCFIFLKKEKEDDYVWALTMFQKILGIDNYPVVILSDREMALMNAIRIVFPSTVNLLCVWHIEKNILTNCKPYFKEDCDWVSFLSNWTTLINSPNQLSFEQAWNDFEVEYRQNTQVIKYITSTWIPMKERFVSAWTEKVAHFGNRVTSRAEGAHAVLKKYLQVSTGDLREIKDKICLAIENQKQEFKAQLSSEKMRVPHDFRIPFFDEVVNRVSRFALDKLYKQYELAKSENLPSQCKGHFSKTMGLPCAHMMRAMQSEKLQLNDIHGHWRIDNRSSPIDGARMNKEEEDINGLLIELKEKYQQLPLSQKEDTQRQLSKFVGSSLPLILEPNIEAHKGRSLGSKNKKQNCSTTRDPSAFEIVEKGYKCGICKSTGHNKRTCPSKLNIESSYLSVLSNTTADDMVDLNTLFDH